MRARSLVLSFALVLSSPPVDAAPSCDAIAQDIASLEWEDFEDVLDETLMDSDCRELREAAFERLDVLMSSGDIPEEMEPEQVDEFLQMTANVRLGSALWRQDEPRARELVAELLAFHATKSEVTALSDAEAEAEASGMEADDGTDEDDPEAAEELSQILAVLDRKAPKEWKRELHAAEPEWTLSFGRCGTGAAMTRFYLTLVPTRSDAWVAVGESALALQTLLVDQWTDAISQGMAPPRLREFAQRAFGPGQYEAEVDHALAAIRIEHDVTGRRAHMPLFGLTLPLPVAKRDVNDDAPVVFPDEQALAGFMRALLLPADDQ